MYMSVVSVTLLVMAMLCFHVVQYQEQRILDMPPYFRSWQSALKKLTSVAFGWGYIAAWIGIVILTLGALALFFSHKSIRNTRQSAYRAKAEAIYQQHYEKSLMPYQGAYNTYDIYSTYYGHYPTMQAAAPGYYQHAPYMTYGH